MRRGSALAARVLARWGSKGAVGEAVAAAASAGAPAALRSALPSLAAFSSRLPTLFGTPVAPAGVLPPLAAPFSTAAPPTPPPPPPKDASVIDINSIHDFQAVLELSMQSPVVLDAWAQWCGPCKQLDPVLKAVVGATQGGVKLAKLDIDNPALTQLVAQMNISSVPTLFLLYGGRMLDAKVGVPPAAELRAWVAEALTLAGQAGGGGVDGNDSDSGAGEAQQPQDPGALLEAGFAALDAPGCRAADAAPHFGAVLQAEAADAGDKARALAGLAMCALIDEPPNLATAKELVANAKQAAPPVVPDEVHRADALVQLAEAEGALAAKDSRGLAELTAAAETNPRDCPTQYALALRQFAAGRPREAIDSAMAVVKADRDWHNQAGKRLLLLFFDTLGAESELAKSGRRRLSNIWFM